MNAKRPVVFRSVSVIVRNEDVFPVRELPGHAIRLVVQSGTCPPDIVDGGADFEARQEGTQDTVEIEGGRKRRARILLRADARVMPSPLRCTLRVEAIGPEGDPTPENNIANVPVELR
jgi:hypothetical protein